jgi:hypothetical protein
MIDQSQIIYTQNSELQSIIKTDPEIVLLGFQKYIVCYKALKFKYICPWDWDWGSRGP